MATFAKPAFNATSYSAIRPTYPRELYESVYAYHRRSKYAQWELAVDLGCGTGQATAELTSFDHVIGIDPSESMIQKANAITPRTTPPSKEITYVTHAAEDLNFLETGSVDLVVSAQAAHWFDYARLWPQLARVLRKDASVAFWGYSQFRIAGYPGLTPIIHDYCQGRSLTNSVGPYWEQPGRSILDNHLLDIPRAPEPQFKDHEHIFWTGDYHDSIPDPRPVLLRKSVSWESLQAYLRTFSSLYTFFENNPSDAAQRTDLAQRPSDGKGGDVVERIWWTLKEEVAKVNEGQPGEEVVVEWPLAMLLCKKT
ncbi:S-adenosyl-L-methionine-dependent methyltransferase [Gautieria morchelliformis]|nr:S-adenosyl-L-methionine-dependent methyltransferase [Gautieria morchelliformis]